MVPRARQTVPALTRNPQLPNTKPSFNRLADAATPSPRRQHPTTHEEKKMSSNKDQKRFDGPMPPEPMGPPLEKALRATNDQSICGIFDDLADNLLRRLCAAKQFEQKSGNCGDECRKVEEPKIEPCLRLRWGDGRSDQLETEDTEILCITVCNPYSNVTLKDFTLHVTITDADGTGVAPQADGTPSVMIKPTFMICYGDIPPCDPQKPNQESCVSREFAFISRGAVPGTYRVYVLYCFEACFTKFGVQPAAFELQLVSS
jgi:hypothetical protein